MTSLSVFFDTSSSHGKLFDGFPLFPLLHIDPAAKIVFFKGAFCPLFIPVHLPASKALVPARFIEDESEDVLRRVTQKQSDLMGKFPGRRKTADQVQHAGVAVLRRVAVLQQQIPGALIRQIAFERMGAVGVYERPVPANPQRQDAETFWDKFPV